VGLFEAAFSACEWPMSVPAFRGAVSWGCRTTG
jgi:hypothetical protein